MGDAAGLLALAACDSARSGGLSDPIGEGRLGNATGDDGRVSSVSVSGAEALLGSSVPVSDRASFSPLLQVRGLGGSAGDTQ